MDILSHYLQGLILGFSIAAPVGPIGILCIRRTLAQGRLHGFLSGMGAATADACYGLLAALGLTFLKFSPAGSSASQGPDLFRLAGGLFLLYLAGRIFFSPPPDPSGQAKKESLAWSYLSTLLLTLSNPMTILSFAAIFAGLGLAGGAAGMAASAALVAGVFCGSALWWSILSLGVGLLRSRITPQVTVWINRVSGAIIGVFALAALLSALG